MTFLANETGITLTSLNSSMLYKFYLTARTIMGPGPFVTEEASTAMDTGETCVHGRAVKVFSLMWRKPKAQLEEKVKPLKQP